MAKRGSSARANTIDTRANAKMGDIFSAGKSNVAREPADYSGGYPANKGEVSNARPVVKAGRSRG